MKAAILLILAVSAITCNLTVADSILEKFMDSPPKELFKVYHTVHSKSYSLDSEEGLNRYKIFKANLKFIKTSNQQVKSYTLGLTPFTDMTNEEYRKKFATNIQMITQQMQDSITDRIVNSADYVNFDEYQDEEFNECNASEFETIDHRPLMSKARHQGECGSCWAFSTSAVLEFHLGIKNPTTGYEWLSPQQFVDCDKYDMGCTGGHPQNAFKYAQETPIVFDKDYPYTSGTLGKTGDKCLLTDAMKKKAPKYSIKKIENVTSKDGFKKYHDALKKSPAVVFVDYTSELFQHYKGGELIPADMNCAMTGHAVVAVGLVSNGKTLIVRNSWGEEWGEKGHFKIKVDPNAKDTCFTTQTAYFPIMG